MQSYQNIRNVQVSKDASIVTYTENGKPHSVTIDGLFIWMWANAFNPMSFINGGQHVRRMFVAKYTDALQAHYQYEGEMASYASSMSVQEWYQR